VSHAIAAVQIATTPFETAANLEAADDGLRRAWEHGAVLAVLPELFHSGYCPGCPYHSVAETLEGPVASWLIDRARRFGMMIAAGLVERDGEDVYNALILVDASGLLARYRKRHLVFWERRRFRPGRSQVVARTRWGRIGFAICADMLYRRVWRDYRDQVDLMVVGAAWPEFVHRSTNRPHWLLGRLGPLVGELPRLAAADLGVPVVVANQSGPTHSRVPGLPWMGFEDRFAGRSAVVDPIHGVIARAGLDAEIVVGEVNLKHREPSAWAITSPWDRGRSSIVSGL